jgi:hypothetical protein
MIKTMGVLGTLLGFLLVLLPIVAIIILLTTKIMAGRWFGENNGYIKASAVIQELVAVDDSKEYKTVTPKTAFTYISIPSDGTYRSLNISDKFLTRGMVLNITNSSSVTVELYIDGQSIDEAVTPGETERFLVSGPKLLQKV